MKILLVISLVLLTTLAYAQPPDTLWTRTYGGSNDDWASSIQQTSDGGYVIVGVTTDTSSLWDFYLIKTDSQGTPQWTRRYSYEAYNWAHQVLQTADGGYVILGNTSVDPLGGDGAYVIRTNAVGDIVWTRGYGPLAGVYAIDRTTDGGYVMAGSMYFFGSGGWDGYVVKINAQGDTLWSRTIGGQLNDVVESVRQVADGGYVLAGYTASSGAGGTDFYVVRTDAQGDTLWTRTYGGASDDWASSIQPTTDGGYVVAGVTSSFGAGQDDIFVVRTDSQGNVLWSRAFGGTADDRAYSMQMTADGGFVLAGSTQPFGAGSDVYAVKIDAQGDTLWTRSLGMNIDESAAAVALTSDGGCIMAGFTNPNDENGMDIYVVKLGSDMQIPQALTINIFGGQTVLRWNADHNAYYHIYGADNAEMSSPILEGSTSDTTFSIADLSAARRFYHVVGSTQP